ncbi:ankyrin repeat domain-containing protein [Aspergillus brunneoviolaceus CBS 621.78]|uniref:Ankyrin n=1 Tax=Aspergillus brunneoviolaceus CBS 621.78 TaxID=1450534 RepID=A0ACD1G435_9EURO|nr:ankyrin [Aspergillus brunneoviolaceus CBS 621.78]RAH44039.1 ankyrin [Aspergillus brunneoviolaceus CBS 621.78]
MVKERMYYIVLDGIDECETAQIREMARALEMLSQGKVGTLKIICTGRPGLEVDLFKRGRPQHRVVIDQGKLNVDMERYIAATLYDCLEDGELVLQDEDIITTIADALLEGSQGMFLWAGLCIRDLCEKNCDEDILDALKHLPRGLAELFDSKIRRIQQGKDSHHAMDLLQYCGVVKRPLTIEEYREALSISLGDKSLNTKRLPNDMNRIVRGCFGLTFIDDEEQTVHYTHHSVKEHLCRTKNKDSAKFDAESVNKHFGSLCMTYLNFTNFGRQLEKAGKRLVDPLFLGASSIYPDSSHKNRMLWKLQSSRKRQLPRINVRKIERNARGSLGGPEYHGFSSTYPMQIGAFLFYVRDHLLLHLDGFEPDDEEMWTLFCRCVEDRSLPFSRPWDLVDQSSPRGDYGHPATERFVKDLSAFFSCGEQELVWALKHKHHALLLYLTRTGDRTVSQGELLSLPALNDKASYQWLEILIDVPTFTKAWGGVLFSVALDEGLPEAEKLQVSLALLRKMHHVDALETRFALGVALRYALWANRMLGFLLSVDKAFYTDSTVVNDTLHGNKANAYFNGLSYEQRQPLLIISILDESFWVVSDGTQSRAKARDKLQTVKNLVASEKPDLIEYLINAGSEVNLANKEGETALHIAAFTDEEKILGLLASPYATAKDLDTALREAAVSRDFSRREYARKRGVSRNRLFLGSKSFSGKFEWSLNEEERDKLNIMKHLISAGADITLTNRRGETALHIVISRHSDASGLDDIAILANQITNSRGIPSQSNLGEHLARLAEFGQWSAVELLIKSGASERNQKDIVVLLTEYGSDPNTLDGFGQTALHCAAEKGFAEITAYLLKVTDASIVDTKSRTALRCARDNGHASTVKMLLPFAGPPDEGVDNKGRNLKYWKNMLDYATD